MTDPYNSYGLHVSPLVPQATAAPPVIANPDPIARLSVSQSWKAKFRLIDKAGGPD